MQEWTARAKWCGAVHGFGYQDYEPQANVACATLSVRQPVTITAAVVETDRIREK